MMNSYSKELDILERTLKEQSGENVPDEAHALARQHLAALRRRLDAPRAESWFRLGRLGGANRLWWVAWGAGVLFALALAFGTTPWTRQGNPVFAEVVRQLAESRPYRCLCEVEYEGKPSHSYELTRLSLTQRREAFPDGMVRVFDLAARRTLELHPAERFAVETTWSDSEPRIDPDLLQIASGVKDREAEDIGTRQVEGREAQGFRFANEYNHFTLWVDVATKRPLRFEIIHPRDSRKITMSRFEFDIEPDPELFSTRAPEGYKVQHVDNSGRDAFRPYAYTRRVEDKGVVREPTRVLCGSLTQRRELLADGTIRVFDLEAGRILTLRPDTGQADLQTVDGGLKDFDLLAHIESMQVGGTELGVQQIDGREARGFRQVRPGNEFTLWKDVKTGVAVCFEVCHTETGRRIIMSNFDFNVELNPSLFATTLPERNATR